MATFDAGVEVDDLTYDFTKFLPGVKGTIPEPSSDKIETLMAILKMLFPTKVNEKTGKTEIDVDKINESVEEKSEKEDMLYEALAEFTTNCPSADEIRTLPFRAQRAFVGWLIGQFFSPES